MTRALNVSQQKLVDNLTVELKNIEEVQPLPWAEFVKTGRSRERVPLQTDWWYARAASILKNVYKLGPIGVEKLRTKYGSKKNRGVQPEKFFKSSGNVIRKILQQLEKAGLVKKAEKGVHKGKVVTPKGVALINKAAQSLSSKPVVTKKEKASKPDAKKNKKETDKTEKPETTDKKEKTESKEEPEKKDTKEQKNG